MNKTRITAMASAAGIVIAAWLGGLVHVDHVGGTYGLSAGTDTSYCSIEINRDAHGGGVDFWCQRGE
jgi:hypothetical protein